MHSFMDIVRGSCNNGGTTMCAIIAHARKFDCQYDNSANYQSLFFQSAIVHDTRRDRSSPRRQKCGIQRYVR